MTLPFLFVLRKAGLFAKNTAQYLAEEAASLLLLRCLAAAEHTAQHRTDEVAEAAGLGMLSGAHEDIGQTAKVETARAFGATQNTHYDWRQDRHQFHNLTNIEAR